MKKSEIYKLAQVAVVSSFNGLKEEQKLEIMRELIKQEDLALFVEKQAEEKANETV